MKLLNNHISLGEVEQLSRKTWVVENYWYLRLFARRISPYVTYLFVNVGISANQASMISMLLVLAGSAMFCLASDWMVFVALLLVHLANIVDCTDGEIARISRTSSLSGGYIDVLGGVVLLFFQAAVFVRMYNFTSQNAYLLLALATMYAGVLQCYLYSLRYTIAAQEAINRQVVNKGEDYAREIEGIQDAGRAFGYKLLDWLETRLGDLISKQQNVLCYVTVAAVIDYIAGDSIFQATGIYLVGIVGIAVFVLTLVGLAVSLVKILKYGETERIFVQIITKRSAK